MREGKGKVRENVHMSEERNETKGKKRRRKHTSKKTKQKKKKKKSQRMNSLAVRTVADLRVLQNVKDLSNRFHCSLLAHQPNI